MLQQPPRQIREHVDRAFEHAQQEQLLTDVIARDSGGKVAMTGAGAGGPNGTAAIAYVLLRLAGDIGQIQANDSVNAVRAMVANDTPPPGLKVYVSGAAPLAADTVNIANSSLNNITIVTIFLIIFMLLLVNKKELMGEYVNSTLFNIVAWGTTAIMIVLSVPLVWDTLRQIFHGA